MVLRRALLVCGALIAGCGSKEPESAVPVADVGVEAFDGDSGVDATLGADTLVTEDANADDTALADTVVEDTGAPDTADAALTRVRIVAANLTTGNNQRYEAPGMRILQGLRPDIALLQEMNYLGSMREFVDLTFGSTFEYMVESGPGIPNGIVSRYPIVASGEWDDPDLTDRDFAWARIDVPGPVDLYAVSVHLRTASATARNAEATQLVAYIRANVPADAYLVIGGDLNTDNESEPALATFSSIVVTTSPHALDQAGSNKTNASRSKPYDWLMPDPVLRAQMIPVRIEALEFPSGLVFDTRVFSPLSFVAPALSTDSAAPSMQHMAVVRDFAL